MAPIARANSHKLCGLCRRDFPPPHKRCASKLPAMRISRQGGLWGEIEGFIDRLLREGQG